MSFTTNIKDFYGRHEKYGPAAFFIAGFVFDVVTLGRIDDGLMILQQVIYLVFIGTYLIVEMRDAVSPFNVPRSLKKVWEYREEIVHFVFGSLLSLYTLFYFKSASLATSFTFMVILVAMLFANEFPIFQKQGPLIRVALFSLCVASFFAALIPIIIGFVGFFTFLASMLLAAGVIEGLRRLETKMNGDAAHAKAWRGAFIVIAAFLVLYIFRLVPPIPISVTDIGIYHSVTRAQGGGYQVAYSRPAWKFWQKGAQTFEARPGDKVYVFASIFSPSRFRDQIFVRWSFNDPRQGWKEFDAIPLNISGGREQGFRGFAYKENYQTGDWRVSLETSDGREIARISFEVKPDQSSGPRDETIELK